MLKRIRKNNQFADESGVFSLRGTDRQAARLLFSVLTDLEEIAIISAQKGAGIEGQLEDELVHQESFAYVTEKLGGKEDIVPSVSNLIEFLKTLHSDMATVLLNVTAESWLEVFLHSLGELDLCKGLFAEIEKDEARHTSLAREMKVPDPKRSEPLMAQLEEYLVQLTREADFILPLTHFAGVNESARIAMKIFAAHHDACKHLGLKPTEEIRKAERALRLALKTPEPKPVKLLDEWQDFRIDMFNGGVGQMRNSMEVPYKGTVIDFEVHLGQAFSYALAELPESNRVIANGKLYQCQEPLIGFRRADFERKVLTIHLLSPHRNTLEEANRELKKSSDDIKSTPYCALKDWMQYEDMAPPSRCAMMVSNVGIFPAVLRGSAPIVPLEGVTSVATISTPTEVPRRVGDDGIRWERVIPVEVVSDHRAFDGPMLAKLCEYTLKWFK